jgi:hypothetical protein
MFCTVIHATNTFVESFGSMIGFDCHRVIIKYIKKNMILFMCPEVATGKNLVFLLKDYGFEIALGEQNMLVPHNIFYFFFLLVKT